MVSRVQVLIAAVCFGTTGTAQALGPAASPATVGASRIVAGALLLVLVAAVGMRGRGWRRPALGPAALGGLAVAVYQVSFFAAVADTGVAVGTVVALGSAPALAGGAAWLVDGERPGSGWAMATALAAAGVGCLALAGGGQAEISLAGVALALVAGAGYAALTLTSKRLLRGGTRPEEAMALTFGTGAVLLAPVLATSDVAWLATGHGLALALFLGAVPTAAAYVLFARGLRRLSAAEAATLTLAEPVTAATLGAVVLAERPGPLAVGGIALVLAGLVVLGAAREQPRARAPRGRVATGAAAAA